MAKDEGVVLSGVSRDMAYNLDDFKTRVNLKDAGFRQARRSGLKVRYVHNRGCILGADWFAYLEEQSTVPPRPAERQDARRRSEGGEE